MSRQFMCAIAGGAILMLTASASPAAAAGEGFCHDYARAAVNQVRGALNNRRCTFHMENESRWSSDPKTHYEWCRGVSREQANAERDARKEMLEHCAH